MSLTQEALKSVLTYNPITGQFFMRDKISQDNPNGLIIFKESSRVKMIYLLGVGITAARAAWLYMHGELPPKDQLIGFKNKDSTDFKLENLVVLNRSILRLRSKTKPGQYKKGVFRSFRSHKSKFGSCIRINKKLIILGYFETEDQAHEAYLEALREYTSTGTLTLTKKAT